MMRSEDRHLPLSGNPSISSDVRVAKDEESH